MTNRNSKIEIVKEASCQLRGSLAAAGIPFEVVPGVSSAIAAPAYAGIPVTHRRLARSFTVVTGHTAGDAAADLDWAALARLDTLVFLMGVANLPEISRQLLAHGRAPDTAGRRRSLRRNRPAGGDSGHAGDDPRCRRPRPAAGDHRHRPRRRSAPGNRLV